MKCAYGQFQRLQLLRNQKKNSRKFWMDVKKLGLTSAKTRKEIPLEVTLEDGSISSNINDVTNRWINCFKTSLNPDTQTTHFMPTQIDIVPS